MLHLQMERANKVLALHEALCHPSDEALKNAREIHGPCAVCLQSKPLAVTGSNPSYDRHEVPMPVLHGCGVRKVLNGSAPQQGVRASARISSDFEANFRALEQWLNSGGIQYRSRVPYEHEKPCERGMRRVREAYLMFHVCDCLNFIPNSRSSPLAPDEMVEGQKINYRTDILASFGSLVLVSSWSCLSSCSPSSQSHANDGGLAPPSR